MNPDTQSTCDTYQSAIASGEAPGDVVGYLAEQYGVQRPAIWRRLRTGGVLPSYKQGKPIGRRAAGIMRHKEDRSDAPQPVNRDPCPRCGVRADYGCNHSGVRLGMIL